MEVTQGASTLELPLDKFQFEVEPYEAMDSEDEKEEPKNLIEELEDETEKKGTKEKVKQTTDEEVPKKRRQCVRYRAKIDRC